MIFACYLIEKFLKDCRNIVSDFFLVNCPNFKKKISIVWIISIINAVLQMTLRFKSALKKLNESVEKVKS